MSQLIEDATLGTDLDGGGKDINNVNAMTPAPSNLVATTDPRMSDARIPLDGSVTNAKVASGAAITQDKLNLNGSIPPAWLGSSSGQAGSGNLTEYLAHKGQPNGYASLDGSGKVPAGQMPVGAGFGTVTSVGLAVPGTFTMTGDPSPITGAGAFAFDWISQAAEAWFGNPFAFPAAPQFNTAPLPVGLIPSLDASILTTGTLLAVLLPIAVGLGIGHAAGAVPDPGDGSGGALATDYLARDMSYKPIPAAVVDDTDYGSAWNGVKTIAPSQNSVYDWGHKFDTNDNGKVNVLDQVAGIANTDGSGVLQPPLAAPIGPLVGEVDVQTLSFKRIQPRAVTILPDPNPTINTDVTDAVAIDHLNVNIASMTTNLSGTPDDFDALIIRIRDDGTPRTIAWGLMFSDGAASLPVLTVANKYVVVFLMWNNFVNTWSCTGVDQQP